MARTAAPHTAAPANPQGLPARCPHSTNSPRDSTAPCTAGSSWSIYPEGSDSSTAIAPARSRAPRTVVAGGRGKRAGLRGSGSVSSADGVSWAGVWEEGRGSRCVWKGILGDRAMLDGVLREYRLVPLWKWILAWNRRSLLERRMILRERCSRSVYGTSRGVAAIAI